MKNPRKAEIRDLNRRRKAIAREALRESTALLKSAKKVFARHAEQDRLLLRRIQILESRNS